MNSPCVISTRLSILFTPTLSVVLCVSCQFSFQPAYNPLTTFYTTHVMNYSLLFSAANDKKLNRGPVMKFTGTLLSFIL